MDVNFGCLILGGGGMVSLRGGDLTTLDSLISVDGKCANTSRGPLQLSSQGGSNVDPRPRVFL